MGGAAGVAAVPLHVMTRTLDTQDPTSIACTPRHAGGPDAGAETCPGSAVKHQNPLFEGSDAGDCVPATAGENGADGCPAPSYGSASDAGSGDEGSGDEGSESEEEDEEGVEGEEEDQVGELRDPRTDAEWDDSDSIGEEGDGDREGVPGLASAALQRKTGLSSMQHAAASQVEVWLSEGAGDGPGHAHADATGGGARGMPGSADGEDGAAGDHEGILGAQQMSDVQQVQPSGSSKRLRKALKKPRALLAGLLRNVTTAVQHRAGLGHAAPGAADLGVGEEEGAGGGAEGGDQEGSQQPLLRRSDRSLNRGCESEGGAEACPRNARQMGDGPEPSAASAAGGGHASNKWAERLGAGSAKWASKVMNKITSMRLPEGVFYEQEEMQLSPEEVAAQAAAQRALDAAHLAAQLQDMLSTLLGVQSLAQQLVALRTLLSPAAAVAAVTPSAAGTDRSSSRFVSVAAHLGLLHAGAAELARETARARRLIKRCAELGTAGPLASRTKRSQLLAHLAQLASAAQACASEARIHTKVASILCDLERSSPPKLTAPHLVHLMLVLPAGAPPTWVHARNGIGSRRATDGSMSQQGTPNLTTQLPDGVGSNAQPPPLALDTSLVQQLAAKALRMAARGTAPLDAVLLIPGLIEHAARLCAAARPLGCRGGPLGRPPAAGSEALMVGEEAGGGDDRGGQAPGTGTPAAAGEAAAAEGGRGDGGVEEGGDRARLATVQLPPRLRAEARAHARTAMEVRMGCGSWCGSPCADFLWLCHHAVVLLIAARQCRAVCAQCGCSAHT